MKNLAGFQALVNDVFALWQALSSQHYVPAAQSARQFIEKMTGKMFSKEWEFQYQTHKTVSPPNNGAQLQPQLAEAEDDIVQRLVPFVMDPSQIRFEFAVEACEQFLREMNVDLRAKQSGGARPGNVPGELGLATIANAITHASAEESVAWEPDAEFVFRLEGGVYRLTAFGESGLLPDRLKGLRQIHRLVASPGKPVSMLELISDGGNPQFRDGHSRQATLDGQALAEARQNLDDMRDELKLAIETGNKSEQDRLQGAIDNLIASCAAATGLGGKARDLNNPLDRNRSAIHASLKRAYAVMRGARPPLSKIADHLELSIQSAGGDFIYRPAGLKSIWDTGL
jgi:hypothetical protein